MALSLEIRKTIAKKMPWGAKTHIAEMAGVKKSNVSSWFYGRSSNIKIEKAVIRNFDEFVKKQMKEEKRITEALNQFTN